MRIATWNIGGGILGESHQLHGTAALDYHAKVISDSQLDVLCLQEAHVYESGVDQVATLAEACGFNHWHSIPISSSHLAPDAYLALGVLSRFPIAGNTYLQFPNPGLESLGPNGERWTLFDKGLLRSEIQEPSSPFTLINAHCFPLHYFGVKATDPSLTAIWHPLRRTLEDAHTRRTLACVDLNSPDIDHLLPNLKLWSYSELLPRVPTTPKGVQQDFLLASADMGVPIKAEIVPTLSDHALCWADLPTG